MNQTKVLDRKSVSSGSRTRKLERGHRVNIREICQKFENLSNSSTDSKIDMSGTSCTPVAPVRRKKLNKDIECKNFDDSTVPQDLYAIISKNHRSSVREKSKMFETKSTDESPSHFGCSKLKLQKEILNQAVSPNGNSCTNSPNNIKSTMLDKFSPDISSPPAKPPRTFVPSGSRRFSSEDKNRKCSLPDIKQENKEFINRPELKSRNLFFNTENDKDSSSPRLNSAPEIYSDLTPKHLKSKKTQTIISYFKNLSNSANHLRGKVKQAEIFVDLTPTTVSPPKHYGTLKKSLSEEHIYAELDSLNKPEFKTVGDQVDAPLHYMCTSLIPPALPHRDRGQDGKNNTRQSVRDMIYGSFASLRVGPKENQENAQNSQAEPGDADLSMKAIQARIIYVKSVRKQVSASSICLAPKLYEALFIVSVVDEQPQVTYKFPLKVSEEYNIPLLPHICFPDKSLWKSVSVYHSETFHFALTDKEETIFGYCLRIQGWPETGYVNESICVKVPVAVCLLSSFSAPVFYKKLLIEIEKHLTLPRNNCFKYIRSLQRLGVPNAGASLSIPDCSEPNAETNRVVVSRPLDSHFIGIEMTRTLMLLDVDILVKCVASLFLERRILLFSKLTSNLYQCVKAISSLLYPFEWPHQVVPVLPSCLTVNCCSEQPYILGIMKNNFDCIDHSVLELLAEHELLIIDVDKGTVIKSCNDEDTILPRKVQKALLSALNLAKNMTDPTEMLRDIMISEAFVHMSVEMIGHYENHFTTETSENISFQKEAFLKNGVSHNIRSFLEWFSETQMFDSFIEDSIWRMKYRNICQTNMRTFFEKRVDEYKWELSHGGEKLSRLIGKTVRNLGEMLKGLKKS